MLYIIALFAITNYIYYDSVEQTIDHHKGADTLFDVWHLCRLISKFSLFLIGTSIGLIVNNGANGFVVIGIISIIAVISKYLFWNKVYNKYSVYVYADNNIRISTGIKAVDDFLGFGKLEKSSKS